MERLNYEQNNLFCVDRLKYCKYVVAAHLSHPSICIFPVIEKIIKATTIKDIEYFESAFKFLDNYSTDNCNKLDINSDEDSYDYKKVFSEEFIRNMGIIEQRKKYLELIAEDPLFQSRYYKVENEHDLYKFKKICSIPTIPNNIHEIYECNHFKPSEAMHIYECTFKSVLQYLKLMYSLIAIYNCYLVKRSVKLNSVLSAIQANSCGISDIGLNYRSRQIMLNAENEYIQNYFLYLLELDNGFSPFSKDHIATLRMITSSPGDKFLFCVKSNNDIVHELFTIKRFSKLDPIESLYMSKEDEDLYLHYKFDKKDISEDEKTKTISNILNKENIFSINNESLKNDLDVVIKNGDVVVFDKEEGVYSINSAEKQFNRGLLTAIMDDLKNVGGSNSISTAKKVNARLIQFLPTLSSIQEADEWLSILISVNPVTKELNYNSELIESFLEIISSWSGYSDIHCLPYVCRILATLYWNDIEKKAVENVIETHSKRAFGYARRSIELVIAKSRKIKNSNPDSLKMEWEANTDRKKMEACLFECCFYCEMTKFGLIMPVQFMKYVEFCSRLKNVIVQLFNNKISYAFNVTLYRCLCIILVHCSYYILSLKAVGENSIKTILNTLDESSKRTKFDVDQESLTIQKDAILCFNTSADVFYYVHNNRENNETMSLAKSIYQRIVRKLIEKEDETPIQLRFLRSIIDNIDKSTESESVEGSPDDNLTNEQHNTGISFNKVKFVAFFALEDWTNIILYGDKRHFSNETNLESDDPNSNSNYYYDNDNSNPVTDSLWELGSTANNMSSHDEGNAEKKEISSKKSVLTITKLVDTFISSLVSQKTIPIIADLLKDMINCDVEKYLSDKRLYNLNTKEMKNFDVFLKNNLPTFISNCRHAASVILVSVVDTIWKYSTCVRSSGDVIKPSSRVIQLSLFLVELTLKRTDSLRHLPIISHKSVLNLIKGISCCGIGGFEHVVYANPISEIELPPDTKGNNPDNVHFLSRYLPTNYDVLPTSVSRLESLKTRILSICILIEGVFWNNINGILKTAKGKNFQNLPKYPKSTIDDLRICFFMLSCLLWSYIRREGYKRCSVYDGSGFIPTLQRLINEFGDKVVEDDKLDGNDNNRNTRKERKVIHQAWLPCDNERRFRVIVNALNTKASEQNTKYSTKDKLIENVPMRLLHTIGVLADQAIKTKVSVNISKESLLSSEDVKHMMKANLIELMRPETGKPLSKTPVSDKNKRQNVKKPPTHKKKENPNKNTTSNDNNKGNNIKNNNVISDNENIAGKSNNQKKKQRRKWKKKIVEKDQDVPAEDGKQAQVKPQTQKKGKNGRRRKISGKNNQNVVNDSPDIQSPK